MSEPFPTKADIEFFSSEEAERIQREWEPKPHDLILATDWQVIGSRIGMKEQERIWVVVHVWESASGSGIAVFAGTKAYPPSVSRDAALLLPRPHQLWEMLEGRGLNWSCDYLGEAIEEERYRAYYWSNRPIKGAKALVGPTPAIALGRALLEAIQRGKK